MPQRIIYLTSDFDPTLCSGVSASYFDLFCFLTKEGYKTRIECLLPETIDLKETRNRIEEMGGLVNSFQLDHLDYTMKDINISCESLPYKRADILYNQHPRIIQTYLEKIQLDPHAYYFTADCDMNAILASIISNTSFTHHVHSPIMFLEVFKRAPSSFCSFLRKNSVFSVSNFTADLLQKELSLSSSVWNPFVDIERYNFNGRRQRKQAIGYYSAGAHKGDSAVKHLMESLPDCQFIIMGNKSPTFQGFSNARVLGKEIFLKNFYSEISLVIIPSIIGEGYPRMAIEAAANGLPVLANKVGGVSEALGDSGILYSGKLESKEIASFYRQRISALFSNEKMYQDYSEAAFRRAKQYSRDMMSTSREYMEHLLKRSKEAIAD